MDKDCVVRLKKNTQSKIINSSHIANQDANKNESNRTHPSGELFNLTDQKTY